MSAFVLKKKVQPTLVRKHCSLKDPLNTTSAQITNSEVYQMYLKAKSIKHVSVQETKLSQNK